VERKFEMNNGTGAPMSAGAAGTQMSVEVAK